MHSPIHQNNITKMIRNLNQALEKRTRLCSVLFNIMNLRANERKQERERSALTEAGNKNTFFFFCTYFVYP